MARALRWTARIVLGVLGLAVLAIAIVIGALHTDWGRDRVRREVLAALRTSFPGGAKIGRIEGSVLGELIVRDIELDGTDRRPVVTIDELRIRLAVAPLLRKTARVDELHTAGLHIFARSQAAEPAPARPPPGEPSEWSVELPAVTVEAARIDIASERGTETIADLAATASVRIPAGAPLAAMVTARARWRGQNVSVIAALDRGDEVRVPFVMIALGDSRLVGLDVRIGDGRSVAGTLTARMPAALVRAVSDVELPGDVALYAHAAPNGAVELAGTLGASELRVLATVDVGKRSARAIITAIVPDALALSRGAVNGAGTVVATIAGTDQHAAGLISIVGHDDRVDGSAVLALDATRDRATLVGTTSGVSASRHGAGGQFGGAVSADIVRDGKRWSLTRAQLFAEGHDLAPMRGHVEARLAATGSLWPEQALSITGSVTARAVTYRDTRVASARASFNARSERSRSTATVQLELAGLRQGKLVIPAATLAAHGTRDAHDVVTLDVDRHRVRTADATVWSGVGGRVTITSDRIALVGLRTGAGASQITADASLARHSQDVAVKVSAREVALALVDPKLDGHVDADLEVARRGGSWSGTANLEAKQVDERSESMRGGNPADLAGRAPGSERRPIDGNLAVRVADRRITAHGSASNPTIGSATFELDVVGPHDITDPAGWRRVERFAIKNVRVALSNIDARELGASGSVDGELAISATDAGGKLALRGVETSAGALDSELVIARSSDGNIAAHGTVQLAGLEPVTVDAAIGLPLHPFDPTAWQQLGRGALRGATIDAKRIVLDPELLARFGVTATLHGNLATTITIGPGARTGELVLDVHDLTGAQLAKPIEIHATGAIDDGGMHAQVDAHAGKVAVALAAKTPLTVGAALAGRARTAPLDITVTVPAVPAREVGVLFHRDDVLGGTLAGTITIGGTIDKLTARAQLAIDELSVSAGIARKPPTLDKLTLDARWDGDHGELKLTGFEGGGRMLKISARGRPDQLASVVATIEAGNFDISPLAAFAPGRFAAARGIVGGVLKVNGLDPQTGDVRGKLHISEGRLPLSAQLGTLRGADVDIRVVKQEIVTTLDGKLGSGSVKGKATVRLTGGLPTAAELAITLRKISPIGVVQPVISADISGWLARTKTKWAGKIVVNNGNVYVPPETGHELLGLGAPGDMIYVDAKTPAPKPARRPPDNPWLVANVDIGRTKIKVEDRDFTFEGFARGHLVLAVGDSRLGLDGTISTETGGVDVLGRRYRLDHGIVEFDGTLDPRLDIRLIHDFRELTLTADVLGRASQPDLRLSGDPGKYTQGQLLSILAGGDPGEGGQGAVVGGGLAVFSSRLGKKLTKRLPIRLDTLNYEAETASSSRAIRLGTRLNDDTYLMWRQRLDARPDENPGEAVLEYQLSTSWVIEGTAGQRGGGADLMWRWRR